MPSYPVGLGKIVAGLPALKAVIAAVFHQSHIVLAQAEIAVFLALALLFHLLAVVTEEPGHARTLPRFL
jgi:hypothetical protein